MLTFAGDSCVVVRSSGSPREFAAGVVNRPLAKAITFPEYRYYAKNGESFVTNVALVHDGIAQEFPADKLENINKRVQAGQAWYPDFPREGAAAGCAYYVVD